MNDSYVYIHRKETDNEIFYIGIGCNKNRRAYRNEGRNDIWNKIFKKHGRIVEILFDNITWQEACVVEMQLIAKYGRLNINTGILANMTNGGEGAKGAVRSPETRQKLREISTGVPSPMKGKEYPQSVRDNMSKARLGKEPWNKGIVYHRVVGGNNPAAKKCLNIKTGEIFSNATGLAKVLGMKRQTLTAKLCGTHKNDTDWIYADN